MDTPAFSHYLQSSEEEGNKTGFRPHLANEAEEG